MCMALKAICNLAVDLYCVMNYPTNIYGSFGVLLDVVLCHTRTCKVWGLLRLAPITLNYGNFHLLIGGWPVG